LVQFSEDVTDFALFFLPNAKMNKWMLDVTFINPCIVIQL